MKRSHKIFTAVAAVAAAVGTYYYLDRNARGEIKKDIAALVEPVGARPLTAEKRGGGVVGIDMPKGGLRLLYLTDLHLTAGHFTKESDRTMLRDVVAIVRASRPDLIVLGGDFISPIFVSSFTRDSLTQAAAVGELMERLGVPWSFLPGNHEQDGHAPLSTVVKELYLHKPLHSKAPATEGVNTCLLLHRNQKPVHSLFLMDTHTTSNGHWDGVRTGQTEWYFRTATGFGVPNTVLCHIPLTSYADSFRAAKDGSGEKLFGKGRAGTRAADYGFDNALRDAGCRLVLCGHNHFQNWIVRGEDGITRGYNLSMDHSVYPQSHIMRSHLGGTLLVYGEDGGLQLERYHAKAGDEIAFFAPEEEKATVLTAEKDAIFS